MKKQRQHIRNLVVSLAVLLLIFSSFPASAGQTRAGSPAPRSTASNCTQLSNAADVPTPSEINFDDLQENTIIGTSYQPLYGVSFLNTETSFATILPNSSAPSQPNAAVNLAYEPATSANQPITITFDNPISTVGMTIGGGDGESTTATLTAYDGSGNVICSVSASPVPYDITAFLGLRDENGAEIRTIVLDYGDVTESEVIDNLLFSSYVPPVPCGVNLKGGPASVNVGSRVVVTWEVVSNSHYKTQTYLVYDSLTHPQTGGYPNYQVPSPNTGSGNFSSGILARSAGTMYIRAALSYQETSGSKPKTCLGASELAVTVNAVTPTDPLPGSLSGLVTTAKGVRLPGVVVNACLELVCQNDTSKLDGAYSIPNLAPGDYTLTATQTGYDPFNSRASVYAGRATTAAIILQAIVIPPQPPTTGTIHGHVLEQRTSTPVNAARLELRPSFGNSSTYFAFVTSDSGGNFTFNNVPVGNWVVFASHRDYFMWLSGYQVTAGATASNDILLPRRAPFPSPIPGAALDFSVANVMAFQASQNWANSLPLAAGRSTSVRVFVNLGSSNAADLQRPITGSIYSTGCIPETGLWSREATPLPVSNWTTSNSQRTAVLSDPARTLNFNLPLACTTNGTHHFTVYIQSNGHPERSLDNNRYDFDLTFQERRPLGVHVVRISLRHFILCPTSLASRDEPPWSEVAPAMRKLIAMFPTYVYIIDGGTGDYCASPRSDSSLAGWWWINLGLSIRYLEYSIESAPGYIFNGPVRMAYGLVDGHECDGDGNCSPGQTPMVLSHHWVSSGMTAFIRDTISAHEIGHARGLLHAGNSHGEASGGSWTAWPYLHGAFSQLGATETWGYEPGAVDATHPQGLVYAPVSPSFVIQDPDTGYIHELMSYGAPRWLSDINLNNLFHSFRINNTLSNEITPAASSAPARYLLVGGVQNTDGSFDIAAMRPLVDTTGTLVTSQAGASTAADSHTLQLRALNGTVLASQDFTPKTLELDRQASFQVILPYPDGVASATILEGTQVVFDRLYSSEAPQVSITSPTDSGTYDQTLTLNWDASDADGDPLSFDIRYSPDGGATWQGVAALLPDELRSFEVDLTTLPGSENAFFKVTASDGLLTTDAITAAPLVIQRKAPNAIVDSLTDGDLFSTQQVIRLEGTMMDAEDQPPFTDATFVWTSDRDGTIGVGQNTTVYGLTPGRHKITLTITDSDGMTGNASVNIVVWSLFTYLPLITR
jgi:hypothetical protein